MRVLSGVFLLAGFFFLGMGLTMPMFAEDSDAQDAQFMQIREGASYAGVGLMIGGVAAALLDRPGAGAQGAGAHGVPPQPGAAPIPPPTPGWGPPHG